MMATSNDSGRLWISNGVIHYSSEAYGSWSLPLAEVRVIGEYTNQDGPFADDFFFVFVRSADEMWFDASFYGEGREDFLKELGTELNQSFETSLVYSTDFDSKVWWPENLRGEKLFEFETEGLWDKLRFRNKQYLASSVIAFLEGSS